jgi:hypothetical protein
MRIASRKPNVLRLHDNISNTRLELYFRTPTAREQAAYTNGMTKRVRNNIINCTGECRQKYGKEILEGWRAGDFGEEKNGEVVPVNSTPGDAHFRKDWKDWFQTHNADLIERLAIHAFENTTDTDDADGLPGGEDGGQGDDDGDVTDPN